MEGAFHWLKYGEVSAPTLTLALHGRAAEIRLCKAIHPCKN